jgi:hypothetical protein
MRRDTVSPFRDKLWDLFREQAKGMDGANVVLALKQAGEGRRAARQRLDITWLTVACIKLKEIKAGKSLERGSRGKEPSKPQRLAP